MPPAGRLIGSVGCLPPPPPHSALLPPTRTQSILGGVGAGTLARNGRGRCGFWSRGLRVSKATELSTCEFC